MPDSVLVTGASGLIGSHVLRCLDQGDADVVALSRALGGAREARAGSGVIFRGRGPSARSSPRCVQRRSSISRAKCGGSGR